MDGRCTRQTFASITVKIISVANILVCVHDVIALQAMMTVATNGQSGIAKNLNGGKIY